MLSSSLVKRFAFELGIDSVGIAPCSPVQNKDKFLNWLKKGCAGEMHYLGKNKKERFDPAILFPGAISIISIGMNYGPTAEYAGSVRQPFKVAKYAWGKDYHITIRNILRRFLNKLQSVDPAINGRICVDTAPFMDKYWAEKAGLGWQGKHTGLVSREFGCRLNIGALIINRNVDSYDRPHSNHCGTCSACIDACPTGALVKPYELDATKCISYWTIESKRESFPPEIKSRLNKWVLGCDICFDACPFNRFEKPHKMEGYDRLEAISLVETGDIFEFAEDEFKRVFSESPFLRAGMKRIKRNLRAAGYSGKSVR